MIYIDMDGVVADFDKAILEVFGEEYCDRVATDFWKDVCVEQKVFERMPPIHEGMNMVHRIKANHDICFMTSTGGLPHHIDIAKQKLTWLHEHDLGKYPVAFCMNTKGKGLYAHPGAVLIDDRQKVCDAWAEGGGDAILFTRENALRIASSVRGMTNA